MFIVFFLYAHIYVTLYEYVRVHYNILEQKSYPSHISAANNLLDTLATSAGTQSGLTECAASKAMQRLPIAASRNFSKAI